MLSRFLSNRGDDPFSSLQREIGRAVEDVFRGAPAALRGLGGPGFAPSLDVRETAEGLELTAELPGVAEGDIELSLEDDVLLLRGEKREEFHGRKDAQTAAREKLAAERKAGHWATARDDDE